jgi:hypothetical protein
LFLVVVLLRLLFVYKIPLFIDVVVVLVICCFCYGIVAML